MSKPEVTITLGRSGQVVRRGTTSSNVSGSKRSNGESGRTDRIFFGANKRQHGDGIKWSPGSARVDGPRIGRNDLRLKLIHKSLSKQIKGVNEDRRKRYPYEKLSKATQPSSSVSMLQHSPELKGSSILRRMPPGEITNDLRRGASSRKFYSSHEMTGRQTGPGPITMKATPETAKPVEQNASASGMMQKSSHMDFLRGEERLTVASLLHSLGLEKYAITFRAEEVDMTALKQMGDKDLKEMGIPMGPRKKILLALIGARSKRHRP